MRLGDLRRRAQRPGPEAAVIPPDPRRSLTGPLDPSLDALRATLTPHQRRLWLRRIVRRLWLATAAIAIGEAILWTIARFIPLEAAPLVAVAIPIVAVLILLVVVIRARPSLGETALAVDVEGGLGDRVSSAMELAVGFPASATPPAEDVDLDAPISGRGRSRRDRPVRPASAARRAAVSPNDSGSVQAAVLADPGAGRPCRDGSPGARARAAEPAGRGDRSAARRA